MIASSVVFARVLIELAVVAPYHWWELAGPIVIMLGACAIASTIAWLIFHGSTSELPKPANPSEIKSALMFGGLYALVLWGLAITKQHFGSDALYIIATLSGLTDMDAITLSTGQMVEQSTEQSTEQLNSAVGWRLLITAAISNLAFKSAIIAAFGGLETVRSRFPSIFDSDDLWRFAIVLLDLLELTLRARAKRNRVSNTGNSVPYCNC